MKTVSFDIDVDQEIEIRRSALERIPKQILELEFQIEQLKESYKAHKSVYEELCIKKQEELIKIINSQEVKSNCQVKKKFI